MKNIKEKIAIITLNLLLATPLIAFGQDDCQNTNEICNPLAAENITEFLETVLDVITTLSVPVIAIMIIYAGFMFVTAGGDEGQIEDAKKTALYTVIGAAIILGAELIVTVLENTAGSLGVGGLG
jgi:hypothetical protein